MPIAATETHDWHLLDVEQGLEVRQRADPLQSNEWEVRDPAGRTVVLDDIAFARLRSGDWLPEELR